MLVRTFELDVIPKPTDEEQKLIKDLDLDGQQKLIANPSIPYRLLNREEFKVYSAIFNETNHTTIFSEYKLPIKVLQVISHAKSIGEFDDILIRWSKREGSGVLVGSVDEFQYLLAEWTDGVDFSEYRMLKRCAFDVFKDRMNDTFNKIKSEVAESHNEIKNATIDDFFNGKIKTSPCYYNH